MPVIWKNLTKWNASRHLRSHCKVCSRSGSRTVTSDSSIEIHLSLRNWLKVRDTVSRIVPVMEAISSCVKSYFGIMAWDSSNHLYALNGVSGRLHVYTVTSSKVVEAPGFPYDLPPHCPYDQQNQTQGCSQNLVVHSIP
jgi:hypothetical protein